MKALITAVALTMALAGSASAQAVNAQSALNLAVLSGNPANAPESAARITDASPESRSVEAIMAARSASREYMANSLQRVVSKLVADHVPGATDFLRTGRTLDFTATVGTEHGAIEQQSVNIHVTYDARPVGGILNIRVELVPVFGGIGAAVRPSLSREFAQAVENFDDDFIGDTITKLTSDLATELAAKE